MHAIQLFIVNHFPVILVPLGHEKGISLLLGVYSIHQGYHFHIAQPAKLLDMYGSNKTNANFGFCSYIEYMLVTDQQVMLNKTEYLTVIRFFCLQRKWHTNDFSPDSLPC